MSAWALLDRIVRDDRRTRNTLRLLMVLIPALVLVLSMIAVVAMVSPTGAGVLAGVLGGGAVARKKLGGRGGSAPT